MISRRSESESQGSTRALAIERRVLLGQGVVLEGIRGREEVLAKAR
jgi:hypothetical protein